MIIINSAAYVTPEFRNELGWIPPVFLPIGNKKLLSLQVESLKEQCPKEKNIYVSLPNNYQLSIDEQELISSLNIQAIKVPENLSLGMALLYVLNTIECNDQTVKLLHGDTLLYDIPTSNNCIAIANAQDDYAWEYEDGHSSLVWCGYFAFSSVKKFIRALAMSQGNFSKAVYSYIKETNAAKSIVTKWYDLGHTNTYFHSRSKITTQRAFNSLKISDGIVWKSGAPSEKIQAEAQWFINLPPKLKRFTPQFIQQGHMGNNKPFYEIEYLANLPLNEIFVHGKNPDVFWKKIISLIAQFMAYAREGFPKGDQTLLKQIQADSIALFDTKTYQRLNQYALGNNIDLDVPIKYQGLLLPSIKEIAQECIDASLALPIIPTISHGDLCFSNILFDSRGNNIKLIDPRGMNFDNKQTIYGNQAYDLAKLCHSFVGMYDLIIADAYCLSETDQNGYELTFSSNDRLNVISEIFLESKLIPNLDTRSIIPPTILLFLSMLPLHYDKPKRQKAMLINAVRLYQSWKQKNQKGTL